MSANGNLVEIELNIFQAIHTNDVAFLINLLQNYRQVVLEQNLTTYLRHASYAGNKEIVKILFDQDEDTNDSKDDYYVEIRFAGIPANVVLCYLLLQAGSKIQRIKTSDRAPAEMKAIVKQYSFAAFITNFIPRSTIDFYTEIHGFQTTPSLPPLIAASFHEFVLEINMHPLKISLLLKRYKILPKYLNQVINVLELMSVQEMEKIISSREGKAFKLYYLAYVVRHINKLIENKKRQKKKSSNFVEILACELLKSNKNGQLQNMDNFLKDCITNCPFKGCMIINEMVSNLASQSSSSVLAIINAAINGKRKFSENVTMCYVCGDENPAQKCPNCEAVLYCNEECRLLHSPFHKYICDRTSRFTKRYSV